MRSKILLKTGLTALIAVVPFLALADYNDATLDSAAVITVGGINLNVAGTLSSVESIEVGSSNFTVTLKPGSSINVHSTDKRTFTTTVTSGDAGVSTTACQDDHSALQYEHAQDVGGAGSATVVEITPTSSTCGGGGSSSGGSGNVVGLIGGGSSGGGYTPPPVTSPPPSSQTASIAQSIPASPSPSPSSSPGVLVSFSTTLRQGQTSNDVTRLQQLLATDKEIYPEASVTGYFGGLTLKALQRFQVKHGVVSGPGAEGYGVFGPKTRAKIAEVFGSQ